ncbi:MAG: hypothetical protein WDM90_01435 [Ferruginibacter sp.]
MLKSIAIIEDDDKIRTYLVKQMQLSMEVDNIVDSIMVKLL